MQIKLMTDLGQKGEVSGEDNWEDFYVRPGLNMKKPSIEEQVTKSVTD